MDIVHVTFEGKCFQFSVTYESDDCASAPWEDSDGHGPVSDWERRNKRPGEMILNSDRHAKRFYDYQESCRIALRDGWGHGNDIPGETKRQKAARAALANFEYLRGWCTDEWHYVCVQVTLLDDNGEETTISECVGMVENLNDYHVTMAHELIEGILQGYGTAWGAVTKTTYGKMSG
jgi:hypothetical protein